MKQSKKIWFKLLLFLVVWSATGAIEVVAQQWPFELWHDGKIILLSGDTLKGLVKYDLQQGVVQYELPNVRVEAFTARKVLFFEIFDVTVQRYRRFFALPYNATMSYKTPVFFELLAEGPITLLAREALEYRTYSAPYYAGSYSRLELVYTYYFFEADGDIVEFKVNKNDLLDRMKNKEDQVARYVKDNHLKYDEKYDLAKIVTYYNSLVDTP